MMILQRGSVFFLFLLASFSLADRGVAAPSNFDPYAAMDVRPEERQQHLKANGEKLYRDAKAELKKIQEKREKGQLQQIKLEAIGQTWGLMLQLSWAGSQLQIRGESTGSDFQWRAKELKTELLAIIAEYRKLPGVAKQLGKNLARLRIESNATKPLLERAQTLAEQKQWDQMEALIYKTTNSLEEMGCWYDFKERKYSVAKFVNPASGLLTKGYAARKEAAEAAMIAARAKQAPDFKGILDQIGVATASLRNSGQAEVNGQAVAGPLVLRHFAGQWLKAQNAAVRCQGLTWATKAEEPEWTQLRDNQAKFSEDMLPALGGLIAADAANVTAEKARDRYVAYLGVLSTLVPLMGDDGLAKAVEPALSEIASKSPELAAEVDAYRRATSPLLRWRQRTAEAYARVRQPTVPPVKKLLASAGFQPALKEASATELILQTKDKLVGQPIMLVDIVGMGGASNMSWSRYNNRSYGRVALPKPVVDAEIAALRSDLMVKEGAPLLTLEAETAIVTAQRGDFVSVVGKVRNMYIEPLIWRYATIPPTLQTFLPLGPLPLENQSTAPWRSQIVVRFDVMPQWLQNKYYFVELLNPSTKSHLPLKAKPGTDKKR